MAVTGNAIIILCMDNTIKGRQKRLRERRKAEGWKRKEYWLKPESLGLDEIRAELVSLAKELPEHPATAYAVLRAKIWDLAVSIDCE